MPHTFCNMYGCVDPLRAPVPSTADCTLQQRAGGGRGRRPRRAVRGCSVRGPATCRRPVTHGGADSGGRTLHAYPER
eukprot:4884582-Prymnesium_polylepis.1